MSTSVKKNYVVTVSAELPYWQLLQVLVVSAFFLATSIRCHDRWHLLVFWFVCGMPGQFASWLSDSGLIATSLLEKKKDLCVALLDDHDKIALISNCINVCIWAKTVKNCQVEKCTVRCISCATSMCTRVELEILGTRDFVHQVAIRGFATVSSFLARGC